MDGKRVAVGHPTEDGAVHFYQYGTGWTYLKSFVGGSGEGIGQRFDISGDGERIALRRIIDGQHLIQVYDVATEAPIGNPINCGRIGDKVSISKDGTHVAATGLGYSSKRGIVKIFSLKQSTWVLKGSIEGQSPGDFFGWDTSLSSTGNRIAISAPNYDGDGTIVDRGMVAVYEYEATSNKWLQVGSPLSGLGVRDRFGYSVTLSADGRTFAASAPGIGIQPFSSSVKAWVDFRGIWMPVGGMISSTEEQFYGPINLNEHGASLAVASSLSNRNNFRLFQMEQGFWRQHGGTLTSNSNPAEPTRRAMALGMGGDHVAIATKNNEGTSVIEVFKSIAISDGGEGHDPEEPSAAPSESRLGSDEWEIEVADVLVRFDDEHASQEIQATYKFDPHPFTFKIMEFDCVTVIDVEYIEIFENFHTDFSGSYLLTLDLDINTGTIADSPMYEQINDEIALLSLCLQVDLLDDNQRAVVSERNRVSVEIDATKTFELDNLQVDEGNAIDFDLHVSLDYNVFACQCDDTLTCIDTPLSEEHDALILVETDGEKVAIDAIEKLTLIQGGYSQIAVADGGVVGPFASVEYFGNKALIRVRLLSAFFSAGDSSEVKAVGVVIFKFKADQDRNLRRRDTEESSAATSFDVLLAIEGRDNEDSSSSGGTSVFNIAIFLCVVAVGLLL